MMTEMSRIQYWTTYFSFMIGLAVNMYGVIINGLGVRILPACACFLGMLYVWYKFLEE